MPPPRHQQSTAWQTRSTTTASTGDGHRTTVQPSSSLSSSSKVPAHRWNNVVKFDSKISIPPTAPEAVTPPPPSNVYRGGRHHQPQQRPSVSTELPADSSSPDTPTVKFVCNVTVTLKEAGAQCSDIPRLIRTMNDDLFHRQQSNQPDTVYFISMDISTNSLTCDAIQQISKWFISNTRYARLRNFKAYKNTISDGGALALASLVSNQCTPLEELHLSHNEISSIGAAALFKAFAEARTAIGELRGSYVYPRYDSVRGGQLPVWIRLEYNKIIETCSLLQKWEAQCKTIREGSGYRLTCFADRPNQPHGSKDPHCSPARCIRSGPNFSPLLHLYSFHHQFASPASTAAPSVVAGPKPSSSVTRSKTVNHSPPHTSTGPSRSQSKPTESQQRIKSPTPTVKQHPPNASPNASPNANPNANPNASPNANPNTSPNASPDANPNASPHIDRSSSCKPSGFSGNIVKPGMTSAIESSLGNHGKSLARGKYERQEQSVSSETSKTVKTTYPPTSSRLMKEDSGRVFENICQQLPQSQEKEQTSQHSNEETSIDHVKVRKTQSSSGPNSLSHYGTSEGLSGRGEVVQPSQFGSRPGHQGTSRPSDLECGKIEDQERSLRPGDLFSSITGEGSSSASATTGDKFGTGDRFGTSLHGRPPQFDNSSLRGQDLFGPSTVDRSCRPYSSTSYYDENPPSSPLNHHRDFNDLNNTLNEPVFLSSSQYFPLYIFLDASAFSDMRLFQKKERLSPFSFPAIYSLCQKKAFCHSSMSGPIIRCNVNGDEIERLDASNSLILMAVNSMADGLAVLTEGKPFLRGALLELDDDFIKPLMELGVIENLDDNQQHGNNWFMYTSKDLEKAKSLNVSLASLKVLDFALVWAHHLSKVSPPSALSNPEISSPFAMFLTSNPNVEQFFAHLSRRHQLGVMEGSLSARSRIALGRGSSCHLACIHLDQLNQLLRDHCPSLMKIFDGPNWFEPSSEKQQQQQPYSTTMEILSANLIQRLLLSHRRQLSTIDASKLGSSFCMDNERLNGASPFESQSDQQRQSWWLENAPMMEGVEREVAQLKTSLQTSYEENQIMKGELRRASRLIEDLLRRLKFSGKENDRSSMMKNQYSDDHRQFDASSLIMQTEAELNRWHQLLMGGTTGITSSSLSSSSVEYPSHQLHHYASPRPINDPISTIRQQQQSLNFQINRGNSSDQLQPPRYHTSRTNGADDIFDHLSTNYRNLRNP